MAQRLGLSDACERVATYRLDDIEGARSNLSVSGDPESQFIHKSLVEGRVAQAGLPGFLIKPGGDA